MRRRIMGDGPSSRERLRRQPPDNGLVVGFDFPQVEAETVFIENLARRGVPDPAGVGRNLVAKIQAPATDAELEFKVDEV
jgi:hypothetical protein